MTDDTNPPALAEITTEVVSAYVAKKFRPGDRPA